MIPAGTSWLTDPRARAVCDTVRAGGFDIYFVGGCVRNALLNLPDSDVDMSTNARPEDVMRLSRDAGLKAIPTGIDHGTVTVVVRGEPFEVTTFRRDVATDGRRAIVAFSDDIADDARRRDFTMNALYATLDGQVVDPLNGLPDLLARRIRFIEDPAARIREDYLRILRFFRFSAWYADPQDGFDPDALAGIAANLAGLETLSAERVGQEMTKLLSAPDPAPAVACMRQVGALGQVLSGADDRWLAPLVHLEGMLPLSPDWRARLAILGGDTPEAQLRISKSDARVVSDYRSLAFGALPLAEMAYRKGALVTRQVFAMRAAISETSSDLAALETVQTASEAKFPLSAADLIPAFQGRALGEKLRELEQRWITSGFTLTADDLLAGL